MIGVGDLTCAEQLRIAALRLGPALPLPFAEARREAEILLAHAADASRAWVIAHFADPVPAPVVGRFLSCVERRAAGEPIAYIVGVREFFGFPFQVSSTVLIPRPETELLVELALEEIPEGRPVRVLDLGTGSGCIAIVLAKLRPAWHVTAVDASSAALQVARANAVRHSVRNVTLLQGNWFESVHAQCFDLIVSNPPYVAAADPHLEQPDLRHEPKLALVGGADGLEAIRTIVSEAPRALTQAGRLILEHGYDQAEAVRLLMRAHGFAATSTRADLAGQPRATLGKLSRAALGQSQRETERLRVDRGNLNRLPSAPYLAGLDASAFTTGDTMNAQERIRQQVSGNRIVLYMKGTPEAPQCGFSAAAVQMLEACGVEDAATVNVLADADIRQGIKEFSNWPTIPQLYVKGEFVGGADIMREMYQSGELQKLVK